MKSIVLLSCFLLITGGCGRPQHEEGISMNKARRSVVPGGSSPVRLDDSAIADLKSKCPGLTNLTDTEIMEFRMHKDDEQCYKHSTQGPCGKNMKFMIENAESIYGICDCKDTTGRLFIYHNQTNACYKIFSQGFCDAGSYVDVTKEWDPICAENPCAGHGAEFVRIRGICTKIGHPNKQICPQHRTVVDFKLRRRTPTCVSPIQPVVVAIGNLPCKPGSALAVHGKCQVRNWDFGEED